MDSTLWCNTTLSFRRFGHADRIRRQSSAICLRFVAWFRAELESLLATFVIKLKIGLKFGEITGRLEMQYKYIGQCQGQWKQTKL